MHTVAAMEVLLGLQLLKGWSMSDVELVELEPQPVAVVRGTVCVMESQVSSARPMTK